MKDERASQRNLVDAQTEIRVLKLSEEDFKEMIGKLEAENSEAQLQVERLTKSSEEAQASAAEAKRSAQDAKQHNQDERNARERAEKKVG